MVLPPSMKQLLTYRLFSAASIPYFCSQLLMALRSTCSTGAAADLLVKRRMFSALSISSPGSNRSRDVPYAVSLRCYWYGVVDQFCNSFHVSSYYLLPECPLKLRVGENSPSLWPTMFSVTYTGMNLLPLCTAKVWPTKSGEMVDRLLQVLMTVRFPLAFIDSTLPARLWSI